MNQDNDNDVNPDSNVLSRGELEAAITLSGMFDRIRKRDEEAENKIIPLGVPWKGKKKENEE